MALGPQEPRAKSPEPSSSQVGTLFGLLLIVLPPILLVEDDFPLAQTMASALEAVGVPVEHCPTGELAIELLKAKRYPVLVLELVLPLSGGFSGGYVVKAVKKLPRPERPCIVLIASGAATLRGVDRSVVTSMLFKPLDFAIFTEYILATYRRALSTSGRETAA